MLRLDEPSAIAIRGEVHVGGGRKEAYPVPHALTAEEVEQTLADIVAASRRAIEAGLDGVEIHSANGYLLHEFLSPASNQREDRYGGSPENRRSYSVRGTSQAIGCMINGTSTTLPRRRICAQTRSPMW